MYYYNTIKEFLKLILDAINCNRSYKYKKAKHGRSSSLGNMLCLHQNLKAEFGIFERSFLVRCWHEGAEDEPKEASPSVESLAVSLPSHH